MPMLVLILLVLGFCIVVGCTDFLVIG